MCMCSCCDDDEIAVCNTSLAAVTASKYTTCIYATVVMDKVC